MDFVILRIDGPILSFGGVLVDQHGPTDRFPGLSLLTGLIANAFGWYHSDFDRLQELQEHIIYGARWDVRPRHFIDYQTVDLAQPKMANHGWTTRGYSEYRKGGSAKKGIHQRFRHFWADGLMTVVLSVRNLKDPNVIAIKDALMYPARPLFLGRKTCIPARPLLDPAKPVLHANSVVDALRSVPLWDRYGRCVTEVKEVEACWPSNDDAIEGFEHSFQDRKVYDMREWKSQLPAGSRYRKEGLLEVQPT